METLMTPRDTKNACTVSVGAHPSTKENDSVGGVKSSGLRVDPPHRMMSGRTQSLSAGEAHPFGQHPSPDWHCTMGRPTHMSPEHMSSDVHSSKSSQAPLFGWLTQPCAGSHTPMEHTVVSVEQ